ncbi:hypothetical protein [Agarilytica rhodophyticola]|uniref:hypothetical protein n=1 Tax=Agarilytica rhodophyticola TaxID=1737490 RepID=UPI000B34257A|nr:hypothetical protein [Agarilytica rhodophyticola]
MRVAVSKRGVYHADLYCSDTSAAKKALREHRVSLLAIDFYLKGRDNGVTIIAWGKVKNVLPQYVVVTESERSKRILLSLELKNAGYCSADGTTFMKY